MAVEKREPRDFKRAAKAFFKRCEKAVSSESLKTSLSLPYRFDIDSCLFFKWEEEDFCRLGVKMREYFWDLYAFDENDYVSILKLKRKKGLDNGKVSEKTAFKKIFEIARDYDIYFGFGFETDKRVVKKGETLESMLVEADLMERRE